MYASFDGNDLQDLYIAMTKAMVSSPPYFMGETFDFGIDFKGGGSR